MEEVDMGRELRRKQAKKEGKNLKQETKVEQNQIKKLSIGVPPCFHSKL